MQRRTPGDPKLNPSISNYRFVRRAFSTIAWLASEVSSAWMAEGRCFRTPAGFTPLQVFAVHGLLLPFVHEEIAYEGYSCIYIGLPVGRGYVTTRAGPTCPAGAGCCSHRRCVLRPGAHGVHPDGSNR